MPVAITQPRIGAPLSAFGLAVANVRKRDRFTGVSVTQVHIAVPTRQNLQGKIVRQCTRSLRSLLHLRRPWHTRERVCSRLSSVWNCVTRATADLGDGVGRGYALRWLSVRVRRQCLGAGCHIVVCHRAAPAPGRSAGPATKILLPSLLWVLRWIKFAALLATSTLGAPSAVCIVACALLVRMSSHFERSQPAPFL